MTDPAQPADPAASPPGGPPRVHGAARVVRLAGCVLVGLIAGAAGLLVSRAGVLVGDVVLPWGLAAALVGALLLFLGARATARTGGVVAAAIGWFVPLGAGGLYHPGGDIVLGQDWRGLLYPVIGILLVALIGIRSWAADQPAPRPPSSRPPSPRPPSSRSRP